MSRVTFEGSLKITNANVLVNVLKKGIGRERAYGMGMLTVIPQFN
ncbi:type I-E CRISPR-associated protein Cas6/Cse3/CasE [Limosilactobacillus vaginalis]|nr:type I-E CRISPR-associated protein Cas6/Cse3/CasE [Limosilactobacillus vaginalis]